jgi:hypothetical protein
MPSDVRAISGFPNVSSAPAKVVVTNVTTKSKRWSK